MTTETYDKGLEIRRAVLGAEYVDKSIASADDFNQPMQELVTEYCWGSVWGRSGLPRRTRSLLNLAMLSALNRPHELRLHLRGALTNGVTQDEIREVFLHQRLTPFALRVKFSTNTLLTNFDTSRYIYR